MASPKFRIKIPENPGELLDLGNKINAKHQADGSASPLNVLQTNGWDTMGPVTQECLTSHQQAEEFSRKAEELYRKRDGMLKQVESAIKSSRDLLLGVYRDNPKSLGQWGFQVDDSPSTKKPKENTV